VVTLRSRRRSSVDHVVFSVERETHLPIGEWVVLDIRVNGSRLQEMVRAVEASQATGNAKDGVPGRYMGLQPRPDTFPIRRLLGEPVVHTSSGISRRTTLLACTCGDPGCWPLQADVEVADLTVTWSNFRSAKDEWDLSVIGPFVFDHEQYEESLSAATSTPGLIT
jgi:hypothetical protein